MKTTHESSDVIVARKRRVTALLGALACLSLLATAAVSSGRVLAAGPARALPGRNAAAAACDPASFNQAEQRFLELDAVRQQDPALVSQTDLRSSAALYITEADKCFVANDGLASEELASSVHADDPLPPIDDGGMWMFSGPAPHYVLRGTKWGGYPAVLGTPGGTVTYSYMPNGLSFAAEGYGTSVAIQSLSTYSACFLTEISNAFAAWSAVANIQFVQVADNGLGFDASGAQGDIRIGAHSFGGPGGVLAHAYYPPLNGVSAAGDVHFDSSDNWSCNTTWIDIGIVAMHEIGHSIGLEHQPGPPPPGILAVMNPVYNSSLPVLQPDDATGAAAVYGPAPVPTFIISGNAGAPGAVLWYFDGTQKTVVANGSGDYSIPVPSGWSGTVTPLKPGYHFDPWNRSYSSSVSDLIDQDFAADPFARTDFDGDGKTDPTKFVPATGKTWWIRSSDAAWASADLGMDTTSYVPRSDFDGDGRADPAKFLSSGALWYIKSSTGSWDAFSVGADYNTAAAGSDFDGDQRTDPAKYLPNGAVWYLQSSTGLWDGEFIGVDAAPYLPASDYDGDGKTDMAKYVSSGAIWYLKSSTGTWDGIYIGTDGAPVAGSDFDGDGRTDPAKFVSSSNSLWYLESSSGTWKGVYLGPGTLTYVTASDFDGDGKTEPAAFNTGTKMLWYRLSTTGTWDQKYMDYEDYQIVN